MSWIKRNLFFVLGSVLALGLMIGAGIFNFTRWKSNSDNGEKLKAQYAELERLNNANPNPGSDKVDNITEAKKQEEDLRQFLKKTHQHFERIPAIPDSATVTSEEFASALRRTVDQLLHDAASASVILPPKNPTTGAPYYFSFEAERPLVKFALTNLGPLAIQLGEIKAICDVLFQANVNSLDGIRRERVSADDQAGSQSDYLIERSKTNELAILVPYEVTFRSFSTELAAVLAGFAASPKGFVVKTLNLEPAPASGGPETQAGGAVATSGEGEGAPPAAMPTHGAPTVTGASPARGGLQTVLNERQLRVTMLIEVVKLLPRK